MTTAAAVEGRSFSVLGHLAKLKLASSETNGNCYVFELVSPPGLGVPLHVHTHEDEVIYVVDGEFEISAGDAICMAATGAVVFLPRRVPHSFKNAGTNPGRIIFTVVPGSNFEAFFEELSALPPGPPEMHRVRAIFSKFAIELL